MLRLWIFQPESTNISIKLHLANFTDDCPSYIALSYVWGGSENAVTISVNGKPSQITANLCAFLEILGSDATYIDYYFWADQISMNQTNVRKRDHQVSMMGSLYANVEVVFACLGG
jgi:hypothetical protein